MKQHFVMFARYNSWANRRVYAAAAALPEADYLADRGAFFGSVHGTLNHLLVTDRIWMQRFTGAGPTYPALDLILHETLPALSEERRREDERMIGWVEELDESALEGSFTFTPITNPRPMTSALAPALAHLFNHQTHHRGQVHTLLTSIAGREAAPALDLILFQRETAAGQLG